MTATPQLPYPYDDGATILLAAEAAQRLAYHTQRNPVDGEDPKEVPLLNDEPVYQLDARRVALLPNGWVRAEVPFYDTWTYNDDKKKAEWRPKSIENLTSVLDILLPPHQVIGIQAGWLGYNAPGYSNEGNRANEQKREESWGITTDS